MSKVLATLFVIAIGTNAATYYSTELPLAGYIILFGGLWFATVGLFNASWRRSSLGLVNMQALMWLLMLSLTPIFMVFSGQTFERGIWTSHASVVVIFCATAVIVANPEFRVIMRKAVLATISIGVALNLYELFISNNTWSISPGRSAGLYVNPNTSAAVLTLYGIVYFALRDLKQSKFDVVVLAILFIGVLTTFSRGGFVLLILCAIASLIVRKSSVISSKFIGRVMSAVVCLGLVAWLSFTIVLPKLSLTEDAAMRLDSIQSNAFRKDYGTDRASGAVAGWAKFRKSPISGLGVRTSLEMEQGPHNMLVGLAMDMGVFALALYLWLILHMTWTGAKDMLKPSPGPCAWLVGGWLLVHGISSHTVIYAPASVAGLGIAVALWYARARPVHRSRRVPAVQLDSVDRTVRREV